MGTNGIKAHCFLLVGSEASRALFAEDMVLCWLHAKQCGTENGFSTKVTPAEARDGTQASPGFTQSVQQAGCRSQGGSDIFTVGQRTSQVVTQSIGSELN